MFSATEAKADMAVITPPTLDDLGIQGCLGLAGLLLAKQKRLPVAPTRRLTLIHMHQLRELGVIEAPWPEARWETDPMAEETPLEQIQWRYAWGDYLREGLLETLEDFLESVPKDDYGIACRVRLWQELATSEAERFFESQLLKYQLDGTWAQDLTFVVRESRAQLPIAQWRYCCWAATRFAAAQMQRSRGTPDVMQLREDMYAELRRRAHRLASGEWSNCAFVPFNPTPESAVSRLFTQTLTRIGSEFWQLVPSDEALLGAGG